MAGDSVHELGDQAKIDMSRKFMSARAKTLTELQLTTISKAEQVRHLMTSSSESSLNPIVIILTSPSPNPHLILSQTAGPLFLRAVLEELVVFGKFEELDKRIDELLSCPSVVDVYTYKIDRLQQAVDVDQVTEVLSFMWVSRAGVSAEELQGLVGMQHDEFESLHVSPLRNLPLRSVMDELSFDGLLVLSVRARRLPDQPHGPARLHRSDAPRGGAACLP